MSLKKQRIWIGIIVIACIAILFFGVNYLKGINLFNPSNYYYAKFANVNGLTESAEVTVRGKKVGLVTQIIYNYNDPTQDVVVELQVDNEMKLPKGSRVVMQTGLLGGATLSLEPIGDMSNLYSKGDTLPTITPMDMMTTVSNQIMPKFEQLIPTLDSLLISLNALAANKDITASLANINRMTKNLESASGDLNKMVKQDLPPILADAKHITGNFSTVSDNLKDVDFAATMKRVDQTLNDVNAITTKINNSEGSLGLLINDKKLYNDIDKTVNSANDLVVDLKTNPKRYVNITVFGRKEKTSK